MKLIYTITMLLVSLFVFPPATYGQVFSINTICSAGDAAKNEEGFSISWTMGQVFDQSILGDHHFTEGFQQGTLALETQTAIRNHATQKLFAATNTSTEMLAYPNPVVDNLNIAFTEPQPADLTLHIIDASGKHWAQQKVNNASHPMIDMDSLPSGHYILQIMERGRVIGCKKITKI